MISNDFRHCVRGPFGKSSFLQCNCAKEDIRDINNVFIKSHMLVWCDISFNRPTEYFGITKLFGIILYPYR